MTPSSINLAFSYLTFHVMIRTIKFIPLGLFWISNEDNTRCSKSQFIFIEIVDSYVNRATPNM